MYFNELGLVWGLAIHIHRGMTTGGWLVHAATATNYVLHMAHNKK